jgi:2-polyprenyl-3-methyl-5-hydroxy-6-metoxy-1,4-benzoquinol methylase
VRALIDSHYRGQGAIDWAHLEGTHYVLEDCADCGLLYQKYVPNGRMLGIVYNEMVAPDFLARLEQSRLTVDSFEKIAGELAVLFRRLGKEPPAIRFLDYGFGHGRWARAAVAMGADVYATEISPEKIALAGKLGVKILTEDELSGQRFDIVHAEQVFEHLTEPRETFLKLAATLADGGLMKVAVPPQGRIKARVAERGMVAASPSEHLWNPTAEANAAAAEADYVAVLPLEHLNAFAPGSFEKLAEAAGLKLVDRVRRQAVSCDVSGLGAAARGAVQLAKVSLRPLRSAQSGYFLFARR